MEAFDEKDTAILLALIKNARTPLSALAAATGLSVSATAARIAKLERSVIRSYKLVLNHRAFPYDEYDVYYTLTGVSEPVVRAAMRSLSDSPYTTQVLATMGYADIRITVLARDAHHLQEVLQQAEKDFTGNIRSRTMLAVTSKYKSKAESFLSALFRRSIQLRKSALDEVYSKTEADTDGIDAALITALAKDPRTSYAALATGVGLTPEAVSSRVKRLEKRRIILGYTTLLDGPKLGYRWAVLLLSVRQTDEKETGELRRYVQTHANISSAVETVGSFTMTVTLFGESIERIRQAELDIRSRFGEHISDAQLLFILRGEKYPELPEGIFSASKARRGSGR